MLQDDRGACHVKVGISWQRVAALPHLENNHPFEIKPILP
jgi:hypothetical protein